jgi:hypothetical protein
MVGPGEDFLGTRRFHQKTERHYRHPDADVLGDTQIVRDKRSVRWKCSWRSIIWFRVWAWTETSRALTGTLPIISSGRQARARAVPMADADRKLLPEDFCVAGMVGWVKHILVSVR